PIWRFRNLFSRAEKDPGRLRLQPLRTLRRMCATDNVESQLIVYLCVSRSLKELPLPCAAQKFIPVNHHAPSREDSIRHTRDLDSLKHRIIHAHVVSFGADGVFAVGIEDNQVGVAADGDRSFSWIQAEELGGSGGNQLDKPVQAETAVGDSAGINQAHPVLDAWAAIGNLREVVLPQFFLLFETKWTVIGGDDLQVIALESVPELLLVPLFAQRRRENILRAFKAGYIEILDGKIQILRASLRVDRKAAIARLPNFFERFVTAQVHDINRRAGHFRQRNRPRRGLSLRCGRTGQRMILRSLFSLGKRLLNNDIDRASVLGMHANQPAILCGSLQGLEDAGIVQHEHAGVSHEKLKAGNALAHQRIHFLQLRIAQLSNNAM